MISPKRSASAQQPRLLRALLAAWIHRGWLACLLWPVSIIYGALTGLRRALYRLGLLKTRKLPVPVIVVGNVVAGGAGKTPLVMALVRHLQSQGWQLGVVSRGHGREAQDCREVKPDSLPREVGDEPALIKRSCKVPVFVAANRYEAGRALLAQYPLTDIVICDDGLQHLSLARDIDICVFDDRGTGNGLRLPAGPLRETWPRAVDLVLHTGERPAFAGFTSRRALASYAVRADGSMVPLASLTGPAAPALMAVAAIARPEAFFSMLKAQGLVLTEQVALPDHFNFNSWKSRSDGGLTVICTEKDAVKLWQADPRALAVPLLFNPDPGFLAALDTLLQALRVAGQANAKLSSRHGHTTT